MHNTSTGEEVCISKALGTPKRTNKAYRHDGVRIGGLMRRSVLAIDEVDLVGGRKRNSKRHEKSGFEIHDHRIRLSRKSS
jgi:hypothetical protein